MKSIFIFMGICILLTIAAVTGELLFGEGIEADAIRQLIKERI